MMAEVAWDADSRSPNAARSTLTDSGSRVSRTITLVTIPSVPSEPTSTPVRSIPGLSGAGPPVQIRSPLGSTTSRPRMWFEVTPYLRQWGPPELLATLPPMVQARCEDGSGAKK
ncbi:hypothetical protein HRbin26_02383 [bacterium HR26]|nr:hypothetical protein HRbin26_02383 [bacterium HR26]